MKKDVKSVKLSLQPLKCKNSLIILADFNPSTKSPTNSGVRKINIETKLSKSGTIGNVTRSPPRNTNPVNSLDEESAGMMLEFLDSELTDIAELESILNHLKHKDEPQVILPNPGDTKLKKVIAKKNYFMNSVTIDLISSTSLSLGNQGTEERSKSKK